MAKKWYPMIDYMKCEECGACISKCSHGVYKEEKAPTPVVAQPDSCIDHCHGCGNLCPQGAITYVGDDTGWLPPNAGPAAPEAGCSCECQASAAKKVLVEYLYLDLTICDRCIGTDSVLDEVMVTLTPALGLAGYEVDYRKIEMETAETAAQYKFLSSPTIRVNGVDIIGPVKENSCSCCGEISGTDVECRVFEFNGEDYEVPPKEMLAEAILKAVFCEREEVCAGNGYDMPENLEHFFEGKSKKSCCCGEGDCCS